MTGWAPRSQAAGERPLRLAGDQGRRGGDHAGAAGLSARRHRLAPSATYLATRCGRLSLRQDADRGLSHRPRGGDPHAWLSDVLKRIADHRIRDLATLLPWNWAAAQSVLNWRHDRRKHRPHQDHPGRRHAAASTPDRAAADDPARSPASRHPPSPSGIGFSDRVRAPHPV